MWPIKRKAVYRLVLFHIYLFIFLVRIGLDHNFIFFFKSTFFILVNLQAVAGRKFYRLPPDKENTVLDKYEMNFGMILS